jgi:hypothetical protein
MGDDQRGVVAPERVQCIPHQPLIQRVEMRSRFVQNQDRSVLQKDAGDGDALSLSAGKLRAPFTDRRIQSVRQRRDKVG